MNTTWIKKVHDLPPSMVKDLKKENKFKEDYYGVFGTVISDSLKVNDIFYIEKVQIGIPYEFCVIGIYGSKENQHNDPNILSLVAKSGSAVIVIAEPRNFTTSKHGKEVDIAVIQRDASYYGPLSFRDTKYNGFTT